MSSNETVGYSIIGVAFGVPIAIGLFFLLKDSFKTEAEAEDTQTYFFSGGKREREIRSKLSKKRNSAKRRK